ncbi:paralemmin-1-like [Salvelinus sp. IW2-2015]|uniref:paralemmin-1-like n=1 Tax=Salvelinus sp. IW2-2015 TaxID=2691554 RepID=UPI0038D4D293
MSVHHLKLNLNKTEMLFLPEKACPLKDLFITVDNSMVSPSQTSKNIGVALDNTLLFSAKHQSSGSLLFMFYNIHRTTLPHTGSRAAMYAMEINVEKDRKTGDTRILSASAVSPDEVPDHGVKVFDDGRKVVYEVRSGGSSTLDNGVHRWNSQQVDELMKRVGATTGCAQGGKANVTIKPADADDPKISPRSTDHSADLPTNYTPYTTPPAVPSSATTAHKMPQAPSTPITTQPPPYREVISEGEVTEAPQATAEKPITMIFMGYHNVDDQDETKRLLGFDGTIKAEIVLIDEDDEKSLREKTVTDGYSTMDGNAADLVSGARPLSDTTDLSSEGKDESSATATKELPSPAGIEKKKLCHCCTIM